MSTNNPINITLSERLEGVEEYYFSRKLREIAELRKAGRPINVLNLFGYTGAASIACAAAAPIRRSFCSRGRPMA